MASVYTTTISYNDWSTTATASTGDWGSQWYTIQKTVEPEPAILAAAPISNGMVRRLRKAVRKVRALTVIGG